MQLRGELLTTRLICRVLRIKSVPASLNPVPTRTKLRSHRLKPLLDSLKECPDRNETG